ncbi:MAG: flagellar hook-basal body complex protein FliE [Proteobacteria bacterium]|nr:flagellar hook-basal body complex protein FliE [Pseudomonadota bacterium]
MAIDKLTTATGIGTGPIKDVGSKAPSIDQGFGDLLSDALRNTMQAQKNAEALSAAAANGEPVPMHQLTQAVSEAELTLQTMLSVRDKAVEAYQQIMQMPI